jgi:hypothetical protein
MLPGLTPPPYEAHFNLKYLPSAFGISFPLCSCRNFYAIWRELNYKNPYFAGIPVCLSLITLILAKCCK